MGDTPTTIRVPAGYSAFIFRSADDVAEAVEVQRERDHASLLSEWMPDDLPRD